MGSLIDAAWRGDIDACRRLVDAGADINARSSPSNQTALISAASNGHEKVCEFLLEAGADINSRGFHGRTAFIYSARNRLGKHICELLIEAGADVNVQDDDGATALMYAVGYRRASINSGTSGERRGWFKLTCPGNNSDRWLFIEDNNAVDPQDYDGPTMSVYSGIWSNMDICRLLIRAGADVNARDYNGWTALTHAVCWKYTDACRLLIEANADPFNINLPDTCRLLIEANTDPFGINLPDDDHIIRALIHKTRRDASLFQRAVWFVQRRAELFDPQKVESELAEHLWYEYFQHVNWSLPAK